jgi:hypothetical protein
MCTKNADIEIYEPVDEEGVEGEEAGPHSGFCLDEVVDGSYSEPALLRLQVSVIFCVRWRRFK